MSPSSQLKQTAAAGSKTRVQGVATVQTVKAAAGILHRVVASNANAAVQTLTLTDGASDLVVIQVPATSTIVVDVGARFTTSIKGTPSHANVDALFLFD